MTKLRHKPSHLKIAKELGVAIVTGSHPPGTVLQREVDFADRLGVSRSVVREALRTLAAKGLVESRQKAGTRVRERANWNLLDPELLSWMFEGVSPPRDFVRDLFQLRMIIEPAAAELAAHLRSSRQLSQMGFALEVMGKRGLGSEEGQSADQRFHTILLEATNNELLISLSSTISAAVRWTTFFKFSINRNPRDPMPEHHDLYDAIVNADGIGARQATETLIDLALQDTEAALEN